VIINVSRWNRSIELAN